LGTSGMNENKGYWGGGISIISQNFSKSPSIFFHPPDFSISQTSPKFILFNCFFRRWTEVPTNTVGTFKLL
jgi:hypothetical protein